MNYKSIYLIGFMGSGKTTVGKSLTKYIDYKLVDTDELIVQDLNMQITEIFASKGEEYFRDLESEKLKQLLLESNLIVSTGGGIILRDVNRDILKNSFSIYLKTSYDKIFDRIKNDKTRPLLNTEDSYSSGLKLFESRRIIYESFEFQINTDDFPPDDIAKKILAIYSNVKN